VEMSAYCKIRASDYRLSILVLKDVRDGLD
jgi:hypothetical protein